MSTTAPKLHVGAAARVVELWVNSRHEVYRTTIARETPTQWIDASGYRWRKVDGTLVGHATMRREIEPIPGDA
jgi:hypothetical protein